MDVLFSILKTEAEALGFDEWEAFEDIFDRDWCIKHSYYVMFRYPDPDRAQKNVKFLLEHRWPMKIKVSGNWKQVPITEIEQLSNEQKNFLNWCSYCLSKITSDTDIETLTQKAKGKFCNPPSIKSTNKK